METVWFEEPRRYNAKDEGNSGPDDDDEEIENQMRLAEPQPGYLFRM